MYTAHSEETTPVFREVQKNSDIKVFIVDDDQYILNMYKIKFTKEGFDVQVATDGVEALLKIKSGYQPDIIITDLIMPNMDGFTFVQTLRDEKLVTHAPIVVLTNQSGLDEIGRMQRMDIVTYIVKVTTIPGDIVKTVQRLFKIKQ